MCSHLLAAIPFTVRKHKNLLGDKTQPLRNYGKYNINGNACTGISYIVVDHDQSGTGLQNAGAFHDDASHFIKVSTNNSWDAVIVQQIEFLLRFKVIQNRLQ